MLIRPKEIKDDDDPVDDSSQGNNSWLLIGGGIVALCVVALVVYLNVAGSVGKPDDVIIQPGAPVNPVIVVAPAALLADTASKSVAKTNSVKVPYGGEHLQKNLDSYRAKQADDLRKQLDAKPNGNVDSLTLSEERIRKLEQSGNVVW